MCDVSWIQTWSARWMKTLHFFYRGKWIQSLVVGQFYKKIGLYNNAYTSYTYFRLTIFCSCVTVRRTLRTPACAVSFIYVYQTYEMSKCPATNIHKQLGMHCGFIYVMKLRRLYTLPRRPIFYLVFINMYYIVRSIATLVQSQ